MKLEQMKQVPLREVWTTEHGDFTPWLAENLYLLGDVLNLSLELEATERTVGNFRADILARDNLTQSWVLIENQLERTDHSHLGQLLAYAAGLEASVIIWIAEQFTDDHLAALQWLNDIVNGSVKFYGVQIEVWSISNILAPQFRVVCKPNSWTKKGSEYRKPKSGQPLGQQIAAIIATEPDLSDRAIAGRIGCSPTTVGNWRRNQDGQSVVNE